MIQGEINLIRYFSRRYDLFNANESNEIINAHIDSILDSIYSQLIWGGGNSIKTVVSAIEAELKKSTFLIADLKLH